MRFLQFINEMTRSSEADAIRRMESHIDNVTKHVGYYLCAKTPSTSWIREIVAFLNNAYKEYENTPNQKPIKLSKIAHQANIVVSIVLRDVKIKKLKTKENLDINTVKSKIDSFIKSAHKTMYDNYGTGFVFDETWVMKNLKGN